MPWWVILNPVLNGENFLLQEVWWQTRFRYTTQYVYFKKLTKSFMHRQGNIHRVVRSLHRALLSQKCKVGGNIERVYKQRIYYTVHSPSLHLFTCIPAHCSPVETRMVGFELSSWALQILSELMSVQNIKLLLQEELMTNTSSNRTL